MNYKQTGFLLLLQAFLFVQCSTAETSNTSTEKEKKNNVPRNSFADTNSITSSADIASSKASDNRTKQTDDKNVNNAEQLNFKQVDFGFNIGYLADLKQKDLFEGPLRQIMKDGISKLRIYEPFTKNIVQQPELASQLITPLEQNGFKILLCLSNFPDVSNIQYNKSQNNEEQSNMAKFTNRNAPVNMDAYNSYLTGFLDNLQNKNLLQNVSFEIGNEPDAKKYFWGQSADFVKVARSIKQTIAKYNKPVYCCGFTSEFANKASEKSPDYYNFLNDNPFFQNINLSFHFYQNGKNDITQIKLPRLNNSIISEFNMYSYQKTSTVGKTAETNSSQFGSLLIQGLVFAYRNNIKTIYFFKLVDIPSKEGTTGFFDETGKAKTSYKYFKNIYDVVKDKYAVKQDNNTITITGDNETILYAITNNVKLPNNEIVVSSGSTNAKTLNANEWVVYKN